MNLIIDVGLKQLKNMNLTLNQYVSLSILYHIQVYGIEYHYIHIPQDLEYLKEQEFITNTLLLTDKGKRLFEAEDKFVIFYNTFPQKTPRGRILRTVNSDTSSAKRTKSIWNRVTRKKDDLQDQAIQGLINEIKHRTVNNSLEYMNNIDTWLRQTTWEKYLTVEVSTSNNKMEMDL